MAPSKASAIAPKPSPRPTSRRSRPARSTATTASAIPTYFTVGNLVQYLQSLEEQGIPKQEIIDRYVFFTAGACGPCRFGMYEAEYRLALRNAGFDGFRVLLFQQSGGLSPVRRRSRAGDEPRFLPRHSQRAELRRRDERSGLRDAAVRGQRRRDRPRARRAAWTTSTRCSARSARGSSTRAWASTWAASATPRSTSASSSTS